MREPDIPSLVAGVALAGFGGVLVADGAGAISLHVASVLPIMAGVVGAILLAFGLGRRA